VLTDVDSTLAVNDSVIRWLEVWLAVVLAEEL
jgi:hypothetical protein